MTRETIVIMVGIICVFAGIGISILYDKHRQYQWFLSKVKRLWGSIPEREYTAEELESISHYARHHQENHFMVDDITWNDLSMDQIFMLLNTTVSSCGEDVLYKMLRIPEFHQEKLEERNRLIEYFQTHEKERIQVQHLLQKVRKISELSISDYIYVLKDVDQKGGGKYIVLSVSTAIAILLLLIKPMVGIFALIAMLSLNISVRMKNSRKIEPYLNCFICIIRMLQAADGFEKMKNPVIQSYLDRISYGRNQLKGFRRGAFLVASANSLQDGLETFIFSYLKILFHVDFIKFYSMLKSVDGHEKEMDDMFAAMGELDALIAMASFRESLPFYCIPELTDAYSEGQGAKFAIENVYHPLISNPVANSIQIEKAVLITGSNASGKSTFLKTIALNSILAQTIYTCTAQRYQGNYFKVLTSMALRDNLENGESYYIVEIKSLQRILQECEKKEPVLCIVDEVLRGTNTIERIAASSQILRSLNKPNVIPLAATHDIELSYILEDCFENYHFDEEIREKDVLFNYIVKKGRATSRNAIKLLEIIGYDDRIIKNAQDAAKHFEETGVWT